MRRSRFWCLTAPPGATVMLDGHPETACQSPCSVQATMGRHRIAVTLAGHVSEYREVNVTGTPQEVPLVSLRAAAGTLMLSTDPPGANIAINGNPAGQKTPAQIGLAPGAYDITVRKTGGERPSAWKSRPVGPRSGRFP